MHSKRTKKFILYGEWQLNAMPVKYDSEWIHALNEYSLSVKNKTNTIKPEYQQ